MTVVVAGQTMELRLPPRLVERYDLAMAMAESGGRQQVARRVVAAALFLCWPGRVPGMPVYRGDVVDFGGQAVDFLLEQGATIAEIVKAGNAAIDLVLASLPTPEVTKAAKGNSEAPGGRNSESNGGSPGGGGPPTPTGSGPSTP